MLDANRSSSVAAASGTGIAESEPYLIIENVAKTFGDFTAVSDATVTIRKGELVSFLGPSGCGKTTLLRAIAGLDPATSGRIVQGGRDITALPPSARDFGIVFQSYALFPNLTVENNVGFGLRGAKWPAARRDARVRELIELVGLSAHATKYPAQLSGGQQQRVAIARALATEPQLLLLDEPLSALDAIVRVHLRSEIRALQRRLGVTAILVTHDQEEAMSISDRIVVMNLGTIEQVGAPREVYRHPASEFVANFVGRSNQYDGVIEPDGMVRIDRLALRADAAAAMPVGAQVKVLIRPEDVVIGGAPGMNALQVTLGEEEYLGPVSHVALHGHGQRFDADVDYVQLKAIEARRGGTIEAGVAPDRVLLFPAAA
jgi:iron(III) transport system ATP-binding protein